MANSRGYHSHGSRGGKFARKQMIGIDFSAFADYAERLEDLGADLKQVFSDAMEEAATKVQQDTLDALEDAYLPAKGKYRGTLNQTEQQVINPNSVKTSWSGSVAEIGLGFDKSKPGAGGWLITGTPKMRPDYKLEEIYSRKKYANDIKKQIAQSLQKAIDKKMGG